MAVSEDNKLVYEVNKKGEKKYLGRILYEDKGEHKLIIKVDSEGRTVFDKDDNIIPAGLAEVTDNHIKCLFRKKGKSKKIIRLLPGKKKLDLKDYPIQLYDHKDITKKAIDDIAEEPLGKEIHKHVDRAREGRNSIYLKDFEKYINQMREGTPEEQAIFLKYRQHLIDNGIMPVDKKGKPYDLSCMIIPAVNVEKLVNSIMMKDLAFATEISNYLTNKNVLDFDSAEASIKLNDAKTESPKLFTRIYEYLLENKWIRESPILPELNLTEEQLMFLAQYDRAASEAGLKHEILPHVRSYLEKKLQRGSGIDKINKTLPQMRYGTLFEQAVYHDFCAMIPDLMKAEDLPQSSQKERIKLLMKAKSKARAKTGKKNTSAAAQ